LSCSEPCAGLDCGSSEFAGQISIYLGSTLFSQEEPTDLRVPDETTIGFQALGNNWSLSVLSELLVGIPNLGIVMNIPHTQDQFQNENIVFSGTSVQAFGTAVSRYSGGETIYTMISAPLYSNEYWQQGAVYVYHDGETEPSKTIQGSGVQEQFGDRIYSCADFDGDGIEDALLSSSLFGGSLDNKESFPLSGRVYIAPSQQWMSSEPTTSSTTFTFFDGDSVGSRFGHDAYCNADLDGDGAVDIIVSAPFADSATFDASGAIYVLPTQSTSLEDATFRLQGLASNAWLGWSFAVGDIDGDKLMDIAAGAPGINSSLGSIYVWKGSDLQINQTAPTIEFRSNQTRIGKEVHISDINHDGLDDLLIGEPKGTLVSEGSDPNLSNTGLVHIFLGRPDLSVFDGIQTIQEADLRISIDIEQAYFGQKITSQDVDGDGQNDLIFQHNAANQ
jgi:hypothetical protein